MVGAAKKLNSSHDETNDYTPFIDDLICHPWARTCHYQPVYQI